jgi:hypothetical protein
MTQVNGIPQLQLRRVNPFQGLMIDATVWQDAHEYHRNQIRLHHLLLHGWGIVQGLDVRLADADNTLLIEAGLAIDPSGNFVIVNHDTPFRVEHRESVALYLVLQFREVLSGSSQLGIDGVGPPTRVIEAFQIQQRDRLPNEACLELARVDFDPAGKLISMPADPDHPAKNELDLRFRPQLGGSTAPTSPLLMMAAANGEVAMPRESSVAVASVAERRTEASLPAAGSQALSGGRFTMAVANHTGAGWDEHREGAAYLARELAAGTRLEVQSLDPVSAADAEELDLIYLAGQGRVEYADAEVGGLARMLGRGGVLFAEACAAGPDGETGAREFALSFVELADRLGRQLADVQRGHPLLNSRHVFAALPAGGRERVRVLEANGIVYSDVDYGCAWKGGRADAPLSRGGIRDALEFGVNVALFRRRVA